MIREGSLRLLVFACAGLTGLGAAGILLLFVQGRQHRFLARVARVTTPYIHSTTSAPLVLVRSPSGFNAASLWLRLARLLGFHPERQSRYPVRWWLVLGLTLIVARLAVGLGSALVGNFAYVLLLPAWVWLSRRVFFWFERRHSDILFRQFPDPLAVIVRAVRIGIPVGESIHVLAREGPQPTAQEFKALSDQIQLGVPLDEALFQVARLNDVAEYRFFATALSLQSQAGGGLTETLENLADVIRKRVAARARARALASEANTSAAILGAMPFVTGGALWVISPQYMSFFFENKRGQQLLALAGFLLGLGITVMRYTIRKTLS